jgi:hypothetical protein
MAPDPGPWTASTVSLRRTVVASRGRIVVAATELDMSWLSPREGVHLIVHSPSVYARDAEFAQRSIIARSSQSELDMVVPARDDWQPTEYEASVELKRPSDAVRQARKFRVDLAAELRSDAPRCRIKSLARGNLSELELIDVTLQECEFDAAAGLDKLRLDTGSFNWTPHWWRYGPLTRRRYIEEERRWRLVHGHRRGSDSDGTQQLSCLPATTIAGIYREMRKGLEDSKNEPGAADFYYGEMEMRRLAARKPVSVGARGGWSGWVERALLYGYWAVSGYGLRASRAIGLLAVVIFGSAALYTHPQFAVTTPPPAQIQAIDPKIGTVTYSPQVPETHLSFTTALEYSARESISLLQPRSPSSISTHGPGTLLDFTLRLVGPVLLAFAVLALRARTKR